MTHPSLAYSLIALMSGYAAFLLSLNVRALRRNIL